MYLHKKIKIMKKLLLLLLMTSSLFANVQEDKITTEIDAVKLSMQGAEIVRDKEITLASGTSRLSFVGLSPKINAQSIFLRTRNEDTKKPLNIRFSGFLI